MPSTLGWQMGGFQPQPQGLERKEKRRKKVMGSFTCFDFLDLIHCCGSSTEMQSPRLKRQQVDGEGVEAPGCCSVLVWALGGEFSGEAWR